MKAKGINRSIRNAIDRSQQLPPQLPPGNPTHLHMRPRSDLSNILPSAFGSKKNSKLRISLKGAMNPSPRVRYSTPNPILTDTKMTMLTDKPKNVRVTKRISSKHSRKRSKTRLSLLDKSDILRLTKPKKSIITSVGRTNKILKKRKEIHSKYMSPSDLFISTDFRASDDVRLHTLNHDFNNSSVRR